MAYSNNPSDATQKYIEGLRVRFTQAQNLLKRQQQKFDLAKRTAATLTEQHAAVLAATTLAKKNLTDAKESQLQIDSLTSYFQARSAVSENLLAAATKTAEMMYEASHFIGNHGLGRIDKILKQTDSYTNKVNADPDLQWTSTFVDALQASRDQGKIALNTTIKATKNAFTTLISSSQINDRTQAYYRQCLAYQKEIISLTERLNKEYLLLESKTEALGHQLELAKANVSLLEKEVNITSFNLDQFQAEYYAAEEGASYLGMPHNREGR